MKRFAILLLVPLGLSSCDRLSRAFASATPANATSEKPIFLKSGQAVLFAPESDHSLLVGASVVDSQLCIAQIDPHRSNFGVNWNKSGSWETSAVLIDGETRTYMIDKDGDGLPELKTVKTPSGMKRYRLVNPQWEEIPSKQNPSDHEKDAPKSPK
jgi:hypothetical protein